MARIQRPQELSPGLVLRAHDVEVLWVDLELVIFELFMYGWQASIDIKLGFLNDNYSLIPPIEFKWTFVVTFLLYFDHFSKPVSDAYLKER